MPEKQLEVYNSIPSLHCFDQEIKLKGNFNTAHASVLHLFFEKCDKSVRKTCKTDKEISNFIKNKYFIIAYDKLTLDANGYGPKTFKKKTNLDWLPIQVQFTEMTNYKFETNSFIL